MLSTCALVLVEISNLRQDEVLFSRREASSDVCIKANAHDLIHCNIHMAKVYMFKDPKKSGYKQQQNAYVFLVRRSGISGKIKFGFIKNKNLV
jgi:hypothetical protein